MIEYLKTILKGIRGIIPNDIYEDKDNQVINICIKQGSNVTKLREQIIERIKLTWVAQYIDTIELKPGFFQLTKKNAAKGLDEAMDQAEEITVNKDGLTLPIEEIVVRNYDRFAGYAGRSRKVMMDWVTEYNYVSEKELTEEQFENLLKEKGHEPTGMIYYKKKRLTFGNGKIYYRHICEAVMF